MGRLALVVALLLSLASVAFAQRAVTQRIVTPRAVTPRDPALDVAAEIDRRVATFRAFRSEAVHGEWRDAARWSVRTAAECQAEAQDLGIALAPITTHLTPIPAAVQILAPIGGVSFPKEREGAPLIVACELAVRMPRIAAVLRDHGIHEAHVLSAWRRQPRTSFHTFGLALDLTRFARDDGTELVVDRDFVQDPDHPTCGGVDRAPRNEPAAALRALACDLADRAGLSTMITPEYNEGHRDHFHVDVRPHDARVFIR